MTNQHSRESLIDAAAAQLQAGDNAEAERLAREVLATASRDTDALALLGLALLYSSRHGEAESAFQQLVELEPQDAAHWINLGTARRGDGRPDAALTAFAKAAELGETSSDFFYNVGLAHLERRDFASAIAVLDRALNGAPRDAEIRVAYARACYEALQTDEAARALRDWQNFENPSASTTAEIAYLLMNVGEAEQAQRAMDSALGDPDLSPAAGSTLVKLLERTNRVDEASQLLQHLQGLPRSDSEKRDLQLVDAQLAQRLGNHERAAALFRQALQHHEPFDARHYQLFPLAKSLDSLGRYAEAMSALREAHDSQAAHIEYAAPLVALRGAPTMEITRYGCDAADVARWSDAGAPSVAQSPIFIVAFPRSGTTLLELTLDAHPALVSMDEQPFLQNALDDIIALGVNYPGQLAGLDERQLQFLRARYWERVATKVDIGMQQRLVDKNPLNLLRLPVIRRVFPNASVIMAVRHPCDVLVSCYMQHFRAPDFALMCRTPESLANSIRRAFDFWYQQCDVLGGTPLEIRYEKFVSEFDGEVRRLADYLQLRWDDALLQPTQHARAKGFISTPSYSQVVEPVNTKSIGRWRRYADAIQPALPMLSPLLARWGYD